MAVGKGRNRAWIAMNIGGAALLAGGFFAPYDTCKPYFGEAHDRCWSANMPTTAIGLVILGLIAGNLVFWVKRHEEPAPQSVMRECPHCKSAMPRDASVCATCRRDSEPWQFHEGRWWAKTPNGEWRWRDEATGEWHVADPPAL